MDAPNASERKLRHDLANVEQEKEALQGMLRRAASELEHVVEADCSDESKADALETATKLRRAASS